MWGGVAGAVTIAAAAILIGVFVPGDRVTTTTRRFDIAAESISIERDRQPAISPDGTHVFWSDDSSLWVRDLSGFDAVQLAGTENARYPIWSPDGRSIAFLSGDRVWKIAVDGGPPVSVGTVPPQSVTGSGGGAWTEDGRILLAGGHLAGVYGVSELGGDVEVQVPIDQETEADFHHVTLLPDNQTMLVSVHGKSGTGQTLQLISDSQRKVLVGGVDHILGSPVYSPTGHILYERLDTNLGIWALPFSLDRLEVEGPPLLIVPGGRMPSLADDGTLMFVRGGFRNQRTVSWVTADGGLEPVLDEPRAYGGARLSPDGEQIVYQVEDNQGTGLWIHDLARSTSSRLTHSTGINVAPVWMPDSERVVFASDRSGQGWDLFMASAHGIGEPVRISEVRTYVWPSDVTADGRFVVTTEFQDANKTDIRIVDIESGKVDTLVGTSFADENCVISPDGRWLAYSSDESGDLEIYVRPMATNDGRWQVSSGGGTFPRWTRNGDRLLYRQADRIMVVDFSADGSGVEFGLQETFADGIEADRSLFYAADVFDITADGTRLLISNAISDAANAPRLAMVVGFLDELERAAAESKR